ncbi:MAG: hypothetical protein QOC88_1301, partial [Mycobacterium sp.]|nr:hypothetical protein [Mycobacterium sp.]
MLTQHRLMLALGTAAGGLAAT